jgi:hypothetical protein
VLPFLVACDEASPPSNSEGEQAAATARAVAPEVAADGVGAAPNATVDFTHLAVGDGKRSTSPVRGSVWPCPSPGGGGGAFKDGPWFNGDGTFNLKAKAIVDGNVTWTSVFTQSLQGALRGVSGNGLPSHGTGTYPISPSDDAYQYDRNPNSIRGQQLGWNLPATPTVAAKPSCVGMGAIGVLLSGSVVFNALDAEGRDAVAHEVQDACQGHPERSGMYHYHSVTDCLSDPGTGHSALAGYALDGFGIFGHRGEHGETLTSADLDECHGHTHTITWNGQSVVMYHYHATWEYPYTVGCYRGTPIQTAH